ncbi:soluble scavenger receptor cysteine-rich domain-containing protein SSC5D-like [Halichondria panicea]|uniref:soluble scavenger receptor cysteine-rich domain-containing protein SSC5D-like n=1 Tax=Halichondria panicea TaxID=6063 RepID=UPI00312B3FFA
MSCLLWKSVTFLNLVWAVGGQLSGDLRLVGNSGQTGGSSGRLEVYYSGQWGTVCQDSFGPNDAGVACRQLGFSTYAHYGTVGTLGFSQPSSFTRTWLDDLRCLGTESRLINCPANTLIGKVEDCSHSEDVALICTGSTAVPSSGDLRLVDSFGQTGGSSGRLEIYYSGEWGTVCNDSFGIDEAVVACRQLGFSTYTRYGTVGALGFSQTSSTIRTWLDELRCSGSENRLIDCPSNPIGVEDCSHSEDVALICTGRTASPSSGDLRLVGSFSLTGGSSGRLEIYYSGQWGTVCQDSFGSNDARVACRQLGFSTYTRYGTVGTLGFSQASSTTRTWLDELRCSGIESKLIDCFANPIGDEDCSHSEDVALFCTAGLLISGNTIALIVTIPIPIIIITVLIVFLVRSLIRRRRRLALYARSTPLINNAASTDVVTASNTQDPAYPMQQPTDQTPPYSPQTPPQNMQPVAVYPTGQYADPQYHTSYPQQPPAPDSTGQPPPAQYHTGQPPLAVQQYPTRQPPSAQYPAGQPPLAQYPAGQPPPAQYPTGQPPPAQHPTGQPPPAQQPAGQPPPAQHPAGQPPPAQHPTGQPPPAQCPTGQPPPAQQPAGQPPPAQHPAGQPPPAQHPTGQPPPAQCPTGQPPPAQYPTGQPPPAQHPTGQPPPAQCPTGQPPPAQYPTE